MYPTSLYALTHPADRGTLVIIRTLYCEITLEIQTLSLYHLGTDFKRKRGEVS